MSKKDNDKLNEDDENKRAQNANDDEDFGLPGFEDEPIEETPSYSAENKFETESDSSYITEEIYSANTQEEMEKDFKKDEYKDMSGNKGKSSAPIILTVLGLFIVAGVVVYFLFFHKSKPVVEEIAETPVVVIEPEPEPEPEPVIEEPQIGLVTVLSERSQRSYVVVASFFDEDMAKDYAQDLAKDGRNITIIPPFGKSKFNRVAIEDYDTFSEATRRAEQLTGSFKEEPWPLKY